MYLPVTQESNLGDLEDDNEDLPPRSGGSPASPAEGSPGSRGDGGCIRERPVKVIPCPRCQSMNTKFCYYNNYSVNQPRHFCRNCQRYWTVGGTLRNVPVGGGSRKKNRSRHRNEPYLKTGGTVTNPVGASPLHQQVMQTVNSMHQLSMLPHTAAGVSFGNQLPGFPPSGGPQVPFLQFHSMDQGQVLYTPPIKTLSQHDSADLHAMYETQASNSGLQSNSPLMNNGGYYCPEMEGNHIEALGQVGLHRAGYWGSQVPQHPGLCSRLATGLWEESRSGQTIMSSSLHSVVEEESNISVNRQVHKAGYWEAPMVQHRGSNSRPGLSKRPGAGTWEEKQSGQANTSPHASSTIEEEGSTPSNGYSNNGYEDASSWGINSDIYFQ